MTKRARDELTKLAGLLSSQPISPKSYQLKELLAGLDAERNRLGRHKYVVVHYQNVFDFDGETDYVYLLDSFDNESEAIDCAERSARDLLAAQTSHADAEGHRWKLESVGKMPYLPEPANKSPLQVLHERKFKLRAGPYDTQYNSFRAIGPFDDFIVGAQLFEFINAQFELWSYFTEIGEAVIKEEKAPKATPRTRKRKTSSSKSGGPEKTD